MTLRLKMRSAFPARVVATSPITVAKDGGTYTFGYDPPDDLTIAGDLTVANEIDIGGMKVLDVQSFPSGDYTGLWGASGGIQIGTVADKTNYSYQDNFQFYAADQTTLLGEIGSHWSIPQIGDGAPNEGYVDTDAGTELGIFDGQPNGSPYQTSADPTVYIYRNESITGALIPHSAALTVGCSGNSVSGGHQTQAIYAIATKDSTNEGDVCAISTAAYSAGDGAAFGAFIEARATGVLGASALAIETSTINGTGIAHPYSASSPISPASIGLDLDYVGTLSGSTSALGSAAIVIRAGNNQWDVGIGLQSGSPVKTADIQTDTNAVHILYAPSGSHTNGINLAAATFTGSPILAPLMTPASSAATGTQGAIKWDANFIYICTAANTWKRVALSAF